MCLPLAAAMLAGAGLPALADLPTRPLGAVRSLHHIQDQIARGDRSAFQLQSSTLRVIDELFASLDADALADPAERRAVLAYAVSGGNPATFARLYDTLARQSGDDEKALAAAVAEALLDKTISDVAAANPMVLGGMLGAGLALINGINAETPPEQIGHLKQVTLLAPGTLIEESALRRLMPILAQTHDHKEFLTAASRYARTFVNSPYASDFAVSLVNGGIALTKPSDQMRLAEIIRFMPPAHRRSIVARQMRAATIDGNFALVRFLEAEFADEIEAGKAAAARRQAPAADPVDAMRQRLYVLMANIASADHESVAAELDAIDAEQLSPADRQLLGVARNVIREMTRSNRPEAVPAAPVVQDAEMAATDTAETGDDGGLGLPMQPDEADDGVRTVLPGYGSAARPVEPAAVRPSPQAGPADSQNVAGNAPASDDGEGDALSAEHRAFMSSTRDVLLEIDSVLEGSGG
jgi:chemotaxis protein MotC